MAKPQPRRVPSDDYVETIDGSEYRLHEGEWVDVRPRVPIGASRAVIQFMDAARQMEAADDDESRTRLLSRHFDALAGHIETYVVGWSWTDDDGEALPQPRTPGWVDRVSANEMMYLVGLLNSGETTDERKND